MQKQLHELTQKEISRKEFLAIIGLGLSSIFGLSTIIKLLDGKSYRSVQKGYGSRLYGRS